MDHLRSHKLPKTTFTAVGTALSGSPWFVITTSAKNHAYHEVNYRQNIVTTSSLQING